MELDQTCDNDDDGSGLENVILELLDWISLIMLFFVTE